ncbi:hypothetical protein ACIGB8_20300 [Promicromonospora sukumoe]|uniref:hypothetical protein n=1 Tax=Promicromonospora sukumoe TaxID=88382 RepID=UPI0037C98FE4
MQRFLAILLILVGLGGIGFGIATATVLRDSDTVVATATPSGDGTMVVTDPGVLGLVDDQVTVKATVPEGQKVTLALGSDVDVLGWVGSDPYDSVTGLSSWEALSVAPGTPAPTDDEESAEPAEKPAEGPDPAGSDMWISETSGETEVSLRWTEQPGRVVLLAAGVGKDAVAPTLELTWPRPVNTPYLWPGVLGGGFALILGVFMLLGARRSKKRGKGAPTSTVRTRQSTADLPRRGAVFGVDGDEADQHPEEPRGGFQPGQGHGQGEAPDGGTAVFPPAAPERPGRDRPEPALPQQRPQQGSPQQGPPPGSPQPGTPRRGRPGPGAAPEPSEDRTQAWGAPAAAPAPFGGAAPITPAPAPEPEPAPVAAPAASIRGMRRSRRSQGPGAPATPPAAPVQQFGGAVPEQTQPAPGRPAAPAEAAPAASGKPMTRREMRMREQAQRRAATGAMPAVPSAEPQPEPEPEQETPSSRAAAWRQTWGVTGNDDGGNR